jgi:hypothetical protein
MAETHISFKKQGFWRVIKVNGTEKLQNIFNLLNEYGCKRTFSFHPELQNRHETSIFFYRTLVEEDSENDNHFKPEWREEIAAKLDVCVPTKMSLAVNKEIRFDIDWSEKAKLFSMYISLPTSGRSIPLSKATYKSQDVVIAEIVKWLQKAGCKKIVTKAVVEKVEKNFEQLSLF